MIRIFWNREGPNRCLPKELEEGGREKGQEGGMEGRRGENSTAESGSQPEAWASAFLKLVR